jgi:hypothetical protein
MGHADYTRGTGNGGVMLIRVADSSGTPGVIGGNEIQFHIRAGLSGTFVGSPGFRWDGYIDGSWGDPTNWRGRIANISGTTWRHVATFYIGYNQDVCFRIDNSGTQGFGGPTDFWLSISRAVVPQAPTPIGIDMVNHQDFRYRFGGNWDGGSPILEWQIGYGYDPNNVQYLAPSSGTILVGTFVVGADIYIWSRGRNAVGWGPWSSRMSVTLRRGGRIKYQGTWFHMIPHVKDGKVTGVSDGLWKPAEPYIKKDKVPGVSDGVWTLVAYTG